jgi:SAM-dependent methyltransferase
MFYKAFQLFGIDLQCTFNTFRVMPYFIRSLLVYQKSARGTSFQLKLKHFHPILNDIYKPAGATQNHYFFQDLWAAKKIFAARPSRHIDIGSRIDGFVSHLLVFMPVEIIDIRPIKSKAEGLKFIQGNATNLHRFYADSIESISSLHAIEHFGLGRYGDQVDANAWREAISEMIRILKPGGRVYFSVPIGAEHVEFNAHRIFSPYTILDAFSEISLYSFAVVDDNNRFLEGVDPGDYKSSMCACGLFEFIKP